MFKQYSIAAARNRLPALVHAVESGAPVELTRCGRPVAMLISIGDYRNMARGPDLWEAIQRFRQETDLSDLDVDEIYAEARDRSPGREPVVPEKSSRLFAKYATHTVGRYSLAG